MLKKLENPNESEKLLFLLKEEFEKLREGFYNKMLLERGLIKEVVTSKKETKQALVKYLIFIKRYSKSKLLLLIEIA
ncbi:hypothetical protein [Flavobacterium ginsengisoli]|uniref:hypothetical protein n=1 Tax=Flavobacterium ginsengisoli TaxID=871694 RepID=UPI0024153F68|nr:hypothetical protein [Flavobacterium ginsengisoli]